MPLRSSFSWIVDTRAPRMTPAAQSDAIVVRCSSAEDLSAISPPKVEDEHAFKVNHSDTMERCRLRRNWTAMDAAGNVAWTEQVT